MTAAEDLLCERDVGYGIEAVNYDMAINSNYMTIITGIRMHYAAD